LVGHVQDLSKFKRNEYLGAASTRRTSLAEPVTGIRGVNGHWFADKLIPVADVKEQSASPFAFAA
jgi:hypothetical protein